jgi:hypothetical protein
VLGLLGGMVMQLMGSASKITSNSRKVADCDTEARFALDQIASDLSRRVRRVDVDACVNKLAGNDRLYFYSETPGYSPNLSTQQRSTISLVGYRVKPSTDTTPFQLQRYARALPWTSTSTDNAMPFVVLTGTPPKPVPALTLGGVDGSGSSGAFSKVLSQAAAEDIYYQPIGQNIVRFEVSLLRKPDYSSPNTPIPARLLKDSEIPAELAQYGFNNIASMIVAIAILDSQAAANFSVKDLDNLGFKDTDPSTFPNFVTDDWNISISSKISSLPKPVANGLRIYQRVINL